MPRNITLSVPDEIASEMDKFPEVNWSAVARGAIETYVRHRQKPDLTPVLERFAKEKDELYAAGWKRAHELVSKMSYKDLEPLFEFAGEPSRLANYLRIQNIGGTLKSNEVESIAFLNGFAWALMEIKGRM